MRRYVTLLLFCFLIYAHADDAPNPPTPPRDTSVNPDSSAAESVATIERERLAAEDEFAIAKSLFNPWYTGPLLTPSAHLAPVGHVVSQFYLFFTTNYGVYNTESDVIDTPNLFSINPSFGPFIQTGLNDWSDLTLSWGLIYQRRKGVDYCNIQDISLAIGIGLLKETPSLPAIKFVYKETFPSGQYREFAPKRAAVQSTGGGEYLSTISFNISKVNWWVIRHPMNLRASLQYTLPTYVHVKGFNSYGGDATTKGVTWGSNNFQADFGYEISLTQRWVAALDIVYSWTSPRNFCGLTSATVGGPFNDQISLAPAIEYNRSGSLGFIAGVWFSVWGRNSTAFHSEIISGAFYF